MEIGDTFIYIYIWLRKVGRVKYQPFLKCSNYRKRILKMIFKGSSSFQFPETIVTSTAKESLRSTECSSLHVLWNLSSRVKLS